MHHDEEEPQAHRVVDRDGTVNLAEGERDVLDVLPGCEGQARHQLARVAGKGRDAE